jgi:site-specific DNA-adenine methylase
MEKAYSTYNGGKSGNGTYQTIINQIPKHEIYLEPMVGNGGVLFNFKTPAAVIIINDVDRSITQNYKNQIKAGAPTSSEIAMSAVKVFNVDYAGIIDRFDEGNTFFYFDPPYLKSSRKSQSNLYRFDWEIEDHIRFLNTVKTVKSKAMISHYSCPMYDEALIGWRKIDYYSQTRQGRAKESIYMNYPEPEVLQDFTYIGIDFRDRQRIKRKIKRYLNRLELMRNDERTGILSAVIARYDVAAGEILTKRPG